MLYCNSRGEQARVFIQQLIIMEVPNSMKATRFISLTLAIMLLLSLCACGNSTKEKDDKTLGWNLCGTWRGQNGDGTTIVEITINDFDIKSYPASVTGTASYSRMSYEWGKDPEMVTTRSSDLTIRTNNNNKTNVIIAFSYGSEVASYVEFIFYPDGTAEFEIPFSGKFPLVRQ